jgi:DNA primase
MLPKHGEYIVITKSQKDCMLLYEYGIPAIAPCSENEFLTEVQYNRIKSRFKHVICNYDNDLPGIHSMCKLKKKYPELEFAFLPIHGGSKDISDFFKNNGKRKTQELIDKTKAYYEEK